MAPRSGIDERPADELIEELERDAGSRAEDEATEGADEAAPAATDVDDAAREPADVDAAGNVADADTDAAAGADADTHADVESDAATSTDSDAAAGADADADVDGEADAGAETADAGADADSESEADSGADVEAEANPDVEAEADAKPDADVKADADAEDGEANGDAQEKADATPAAVPLRARLWPPRLPSTRKGWVAAVAAVLVLAVGVGGLVWWRATTVPEGVAYVVADTEVTIDELNREAETLKALYGLQPPTDEAGLAKFRRDLAQASATGRVLDLAGAERGIVISDKVAQDTLSRYVEQYFGTGTAARDQFVQALGATGTSEAAVLGEIKRQMLIRQLFDDVTAGTAASDEEVRAAFDQRQATLGVPERRELQNIVVRTREEADRIAGELAGGADFAVLASARSADASTKDSGGSLGTLARNQLEAGYADAAFAAAPGAVFGPVQTRFGWNVGRVGNVLPPEPAAFDTIKPQLTETVSMEKATAKWREWVSGQLEEADVRYAEAYQPENPTALPSEAPPGSPEAPAPPR
jgi:peptidyl-prolyl cis-trans isomerase C